MAFGDFLGSNNPISNIRDQINGAIGSVASLFGADSIRKYPGIDGLDQVINKVDENSGDWRESRGYEFQVMSISPSGAYETAAGWQPLKLQINPQELGQDEIFAVEITPTFRGVLVEHQGILLKDINISGTTGVSPLRNSGGVLSNGRPVLAGGHSGYMEFHELRNYFRVYGEAKRKPPEQGIGLAMVFRNFKDREYLVVEPKRFKLKRTKAKRISYEYTIEMTAIGRENFTPKEGNWLDKAFNFLAKAQQAMEDAQLILSNAAPFLRGVMRDLTSAILSPIQLVITAIATIRLTGKTFSEIADVITVGFLEDLKSQLETLENDLNDALGKDNHTYNEALGRTPTIRGPEGRTSTYEELKALNGIQKAKRGIALLLQDNSLFVTDANAGFTTAEQIYGDKITLERANATREVEIDGNDDLQTLAARELGSPDRFKDIVILNNLKPPYISNDPIVVAEGKGRVKAPGEQIILPQVGKQGVSAVRGREFNITRQLNAFEKNLGIDIALTPENDMAIANIGDVDLIGGLDNLSQAVYLKLFYRVGSLKRHRSIGTDLGVGEKATDLAKTRDQVERSLRSDPRIESIPFSFLQQDGNQTNLRIILKARDIDQPIPLPLIS